MKKVYLLGALLMTGIAFGQSNLEPYSFGLLKEKVNTQPLKTDFRPHATQSDERAVNILWTEDFAGTTPLTTGNGMWTTAGPEGSYWELSTGTTAPNGYQLFMDGRHMLWDSRTPVGANEPGGFATTPVEGSVASPTIDLTGYTDVAMEFDLNAMFCCNEEPWTIAVSNDNGVNWGAEIPLDLGLTANDNSNDLAEPVKFAVDISPYLDPVGANNNDVKIRFSWTGLDANTNGQISTHYYWTIDDIVLYEIPAYDVRQEKLWLQDVDLDYEYTDIPANQATTLTVQAPISNGGLNAPTNLQLQVTVYDAASNTIIDGPVSGGVLSNPPFNQGVNDTITFATAIDLSAYAIGEYRVESIVTYNETDDIPENDTLSRLFNITSTSMGHINYDVNPIGQVTNFSFEVKVGGRFTVNQDVFLHGADFYLESSGGTSQVTVVDVPISIWVHNRTTDTEMAYFTYELTTDKLDDWYTFNFYQADPDNSAPAPPILLEPGNVYTVTVESYDPFWYRASLADADFSGALYAAGSNNAWFWSGNEPWVLLNFDESLTVNDNVINPSTSVSQNVPNPFSDNTVISYNLNESENVSIAVIDLTGKVVYTMNEGNKSAGQHKVTLEADNLTNGVYFYTFTAGEYSVTKRMVVNK